MTEHMEAVLRALLEEAGVCTACEDAEVAGEPHDQCVALEAYRCDCWCGLDEQRWPYGPSSFHEECCILFTGGRYCDCKASDSSDTDWGLQAAPVL